MIALKKKKKPNTYKNNKIGVFSKTCLLRGLLLKKNIRLKEIGADCDIITGSDCERTN